MEQRLFQRFRDLAYSKAGISLRDGKEALVSARVSKRVRALGLTNEGDYLEHLENDRSGEELVQFLDAISTNFTSFFREHEHFTVLSALLEQGWAEGKTDWKLWSAASSSGEEPYTIAMTCAETLPAGSSFKILATDISTRVLAKARAGVYRAQTVEPIRKQLRTKYFEKRRADGDGAEEYAVKPSLKKRIVYRRLNLSKPPYPMNGPLDVVFCRNVMIYFDHAVRQNLISEIERLLGPNGMLFLGHAETLSGISHGFKVLRPSVFVKQAAAEAMKGLVA